MRGDLYDLTPLEYNAFQVLLTKTIEETPEEEKAFRKYPAKELYELILLRLFRPSDFSHTERLSRIRKLENKIYKESGENE